MAKNYGEDLYGNESDACSFCGAKRRDGASPLPPAITELLSLTI